MKRKIIINGLNSGKIIEDLINEYCLKKHIKNIKEIKMPLIIPSVDLHTGKIYFFSSKINRNKISDDIIYCNNIEIGKAVRASCSYPVVFSPCKYNCAELIDGGIRENIPWKETKKMGADKVISIVFEKEYDGKCCKNIIDVVKDSMSILNHELANYELNGADYILKIKTKNIGLLDMEKIDKLFQIGYETTIKNMRKIKEIINNE